MINPLDFRTGIDWLDYAITIVLVTTIIGLWSFEFNEWFKKGGTLLEWIDYNSKKVFCLGIVILLFFYFIAFSSFGGL